MATTVARVIIDVEKLQKLVRGLSTPDEAVQRVALELVADIGEHWNTAPGGITYDRDGNPHTASAPGEVPAIDMGALSDSIHATRIQPGTWAVRDGVEYGIDLELGTESVLPRPWMVPAVERVRSSSIVGAAFREVIEEIVE